MHHRQITTLVLFACLMGCDDKKNTDQDATDATDLTDSVDTLESDTVDDPTEDSVEGDETGCAVDLDCVDGDNCTDDICDTDTGDCAHPAMDADDDGYLAAMVGTTDCGGTDCNDDNDEVFPGSAVRRCGEDADCNDALDNDNDGDGHDSIDCGGLDCEDEIFEVNPGATPGCGDDPTDPMDDLDCNEDPDIDNDADGFDNAECTTVLPNDCNDAEGDINPDAPEVCFDGVDQDCDEIIDGPTLMLPPSCICNTSRSFNPSIAWSGSEYALVWDEAEVALPAHVFFARATTDGTIIGSASRLDTGATGSSSSPTVTWSGSEYGVVWSNIDSSLDPHIVFRTVAPDGASMGSEMDLFAPGGMLTAENPDMVWTGSEHVLFWRSDIDGNDELYMQRLDASGSSIGTNVRITNATSYSRGATAVWTGSAIGLAFYDNRDGNADIYFTILDPAGSPLSSEIQVTSDAARSYYPSLAWSGSEFAILWQDTRDAGEYALYFERLDTGGASLGSEARVSVAEANGSKNDIEWTGGEWIMVWSDDTAGWFQVFSNVLDSRGTLLHTDADVLLDAGSFASRPDMVWTGSTLGLTYRGVDGTTEDVFVNALSLCD